MQWVVNLKQHRSCVSRRAKLKTRITRLVWEMASYPVISQVSAWTTFRLSCELRIKILRGRSFDIPTLHPPTLPCSPASPFCSPTSTPRRPYTTSLICCILSNSAVYLPLQTSTQVNMVLLYNFHGSVL